MSAVVVGSLAAGWRDADRRLSAKRDELNGIAAVFAAAVSEPLARNDRVAVARAMTSISNLPDIRFARVTDAKSHVVVEFGTGIVVTRGAGPIDASPKLSPMSTLYLGTYPVATEVISGGRNIGRIVLIADISQLKRALIESLLSSLAVGFIIALLGIAAALRLQRRITQPITSLTAAMEDVGARKDFTAAVERSSNDEIGMLVDSFNGMLSEIRTRDAALAAHRDSLEATVIARTAELEKAKDEAESANAAKSDFLATMSHEIRTPMNGMLVMAELMTVSGLPPRLQRYANVLLNSGKSLLAIINDILDFSKIEAGKMTLEVIPTSPSSLVDGILQLFSERAASQGLDFAAYVAPDVPAVVGADPVRCNQVLSNLVSNALKFTSKGGIVVRVERQDGEAPDRARLRFSVTDTGIGIPEDKVASIFEAFSQADQSTTRKYGGTGIGLTICRRLAEAMGGGIEVTSQDGKGSTFTVTIAVDVIEEAKPVWTCPAATPDRIVIARAKGGMTANVLEAYAHDHGWQALAVVPQELTAEALSGAHAIFADATALADIASRFPKAFAPNRKMVVVALSSFGEGQKTAHGTDSDLALELPLSYADLVSCMRTLRFDRAAIAAAKALEDNADTTPAVRDTTTFTGARVLVADDSPVNRELLAEALGRLHIEVTCVEDGERAVAAAKTGVFDFVFLDGSMPVMDGFTAARTIRAWEGEESREPMPIVAVTAHIIGDKASEWRKAGMTDCITKPFTLAGLQTCLEKHLRYRTRAETQAQEATAPAPEKTVPEIEAQGTDPDWSAVPLIDEEAINGMREMQQPGDDLATRMVGLYKAHAPRALEKLAELDPVSSDLQSLASAAHALKSLSLSIGATRAAAICEALEHEAMQGERTGAPRHLAHLKVTIPESVAALGILCKPESEELPEGALRRLAT